MITKWKRGIVECGMPTEPPRRVRVVLSARKRTRPASTITEIEEQTEVGETLVRALIRSQLGLAVRLSIVVGLLLGSLPLLFAVFPAVALSSLFGIRLPWLLLGVLAYPLLWVIGWVYVRLAERNDQDFTALVDRS